MIQELVTVLGLTAQDLELSTDQWDIIMARQTFVLPPKQDVTPEDDSGDDETTKLLTSTEENLVISEKEAPEVASESADVVTVSETEDLAQTTDVPVTTLTAAEVPDVQRDREQRARVALPPHHVRHQGHWWRGPPYLGWTSPG